MRNIINNTCLFCGVGIVLMAIAMSANHLASEPDPVVTVEPDGSRQETRRDADGKLHGTQRLYWPSGTLHTEEQFTHGYMLDQCVYDEAGRLRQHMFERNYQLLMEDFDASGNRVE